MNSISVTSFQCFFCFFFKNYWHLNNPSKTNSLHGVCYSCYGFSLLTLWRGTALTRILPVFGYGHRKDYTVVSMQISYYTTWYTRTSHEGMVMFGCSWVKKWKLEMFIYKFQENKFPLGFSVFQSALFLHNVH